MTEPSAYKAYRLSMSQPDDRAAPSGSINMHYLAMATSLEEAIKAVKRARPKPCTVELIDDGADVAAMARRYRLADGQVTSL